MLTRRVFAIAGILAALLAIIALVPGEASAAPQPAEKHCVFEVVGVVEHGEFVTAPPTCFDTEQEATIAALGFDVAAKDEMARSLAVSDSMMAMATIARHYTGTSYSGSSATISGTTCNGGTWKPTGAWNNNIESTRSYCGGASITHYDLSTCSGSSISISASATSLGSMNNKTSCVRYG